MLSSELPFGIDAAYELLKGETYNWRRLLLSLGLRLFGVFNRLTSDERESVLIIVTVRMTDLVSSGWTSQESSITVPAAF